MDYNTYVKYIKPVWGDTLSGSLRDLLHSCLQFKQLMNHLDAFEGEDDGSDQEMTVQTVQDVHVQKPTTSSAENAGVCFVYSCCYDTLCT